MYGYACIKGSDTGTWFGIIWNLLDLVSDLLACILCIRFLLIIDLCVMKNYFLYHKGTNNVSSGVSAKADQHYDIQQEAVDRCSDGVTKAYLEEQGSATSP